jgi:hypothetical protein
VWPARLAAPVALQASRQRGTDLRQLDLTKIDLTKLRACIFIAARSQIRDLRSERIAK